jgi:hypothetical protein
MLTSESSLIHKLIEILLAAQLVARALTLCPQSPVVCDMNATYIGNILPRERYLCMGWYDANITLQANKCLIHICDNKIVRKVTLTCFQLYCVNTFIRDLPVTDVEPLKRTRLL